jgi:Uma2 family endonuclease
LRNGLIEVLSLSHSEEEMTKKRTLYFEASAKEVWICGLDGQMSFYLPDPYGEYAEGELSTVSSSARAASTLCPRFPAQI